MDTPGSGMVVKCAPKYRSNVAEPGPSSAEFVQLKARPSGMRELICSAQRATWAQRVQVLDVGAKRLQMFSPASGDEMAIL